MINKRFIILEKGGNKKYFVDDLIHYKDLFYVLALRDLSVRYKQTALGVIWALIRPFLTMLIFSFVFGKIANLPSGNTPYSLMVMAGLLPWFFFSSSISESSSSLVTNAAMLTKIYFPRILIPFSSVLVAAVDFLIALVILCGMMVYFNIDFSIRLIAVPLFALTALSAALGIGLFFSALNVKYRDFQFVVPVVLQLGLYLSPVGFSSQIVPAQYQFIYAFNPMVGIIEGFRWAILGGEFTINVVTITISVIVSLLLLAGGFYFFQKFERNFADII